MLDIPEDDGGHRKRAGRRREGDLVCGEAAAAMRPTRGRSNAWKRG